MLNRDTHKVTRKTPHNVWAREKLEQLFATIAYGGKWNFCNSNSYHFHFANIFLLTTVTRREIILSFSIAFFFQIEEKKNQHKTAEIETEKVLKKNSFSHWIFITGLLGSICNNKLSFGLGWQKGKKAEPFVWYGNSTGSEKWLSRVRNLNRIKQWKCFRFSAVFFFFFPSENIIFPFDSIFIKSWVWCCCRRVLFFASVETLLRMVFFFWVVYTLKGKPNFASRHAN